MPTDKTSRYWVGIDLGTTHIVVAYRSATDSSDAIQVLPIPQWIAPGKLDELPLLPAVRYHPTAEERASWNLTLPWSHQPVEGDEAPVVIGEWARELSGQTQGRSVVSAKSWLSHGQVERMAPILPWTTSEDVEKVSPVVASASYLAYIKSVWDHAFPTAQLSQQTVVITIPASFDDVARRLTLEAAQLAGLPSSLMLLEEPQAVCYDWFYRNRLADKTLLQNNHLLLVCDVGGGTTDFSLIEIGHDQDELQLKRVGVGDHLMLGGDNIDLALAHQAEQQFQSQSGETNSRFSASKLAQLIEQVRRAKEAMLGQSEKGEVEASYPITLVGRGRGLVGASKRIELASAEVVESVLDGFFPYCDPNEPLVSRRGAVVEFGLPYASEPAITKQIADFLRRHQQVCREAVAGASTDEPIALAVPDTIIFNGGVFKSERVRQRAVDVLSDWRERQVTVLDNPQPDLAVAMGGVAYIAAKHGGLQTIKSGSARSFLLTVADSGAEKLVSVLPRDSEPGELIELTHQRFALRLGAPVSFNVVSTVMDHRWEAGEIVTLSDLTEEERESFHPLPPLMSSLDIPDELAAQAVEEVQVYLVSHLSEVGTLTLECVSVENAHHRWALEFQLRAVTDKSQTATEILPKSYPQAQTLINDVFGKAKKQMDAKAPKQLRAGLEKLLGPRDDWSFVLSRALADDLLSGIKSRRRSEVHEKLWFNLIGYTMRPGFGHPLDEERIKVLWNNYQPGLQFPQKSQGWSEWWTCWRRLSGGLEEFQQNLIYKEVAKFINPTTAKKRQIASELSKKSFDDIVRMVACFERLPVEVKTQLGQWLLKRLEKRSESEVCWWALGRIGVRVPLYASAHSVVPLDEASQWLEQVLNEDWSRSSMLALSATMLGRLVGDRARDIDDQLRNRLLDRLITMKVSPAWIKMVEIGEIEQAEEKRMYGDALPAGLTLLTP